MRMEQLMFDKSVIVKSLPIWIYKWWWYLSVCPVNDRLICLLSGANINT